MHDTITYWVGYPADDIIGCIDCGQLLGHPDAGHKPLPNHRHDSIPVRDIVYTVSDLERRFGNFVTLVPNPLPGMQPNRHSGVTGFITDRGYRVALINTRDIDKTAMQESIGEWVEGV